MHTCPDCGQACSCGGDIDDLLDVCEADADNCTHCLYAHYDEDDGEHEVPCCYPDPAIQKAGTP